MQIQIGDKPVGDGHPVFVIAEAGVNHNGSLDLARQLVDIAVDAGADAVKFQMRDLSELYTPSTLNSFHTEDLAVQYVFPMIEESQLSLEEFETLASYCAERGIIFLCTPWDEASVSILDTMGAPAFKVASADMTNTPLLETIAGKGKPMIVSTGMSTEAEIAETVRALRSWDASFVLLHTSSSYPAPFKDINLRYMQSIRETFDCLVGYSGHELGIAVSGAAVALGASVLERHLTLDRTMRGPDHAISLEPTGFRKLVRDVRNIEMSMGRPARALSRGEFLNRETLGKSLAAAVEIPAGQKIERHMVTVRSPGRGVSPQRLGDLLGKSIARALSPGEIFKEEDLGMQVRAGRDFTSDRRWGLIVRYHDVKEMVDGGEPRVLEFHFSSKDIIEGEGADIPKVEGQEVVVHMPELWGDQLLDLCSTKESVRQASVGYLKLTLDVARKLKPRFNGTPERVKVIVHCGGMSFASPIKGSRDELYERLARSLSEVDQDGVDILLENLPPFPWYKGGQWFSNAFMDSGEMLRFCTEYGYGICYDTSHAQLTCNHLGIDQVEYFRPLAHLTRHLHVSDGAGLDLEGLQIDEGDVDFARLSPLLLETGASFVPEIWMGHREGGDGFWRALGRLKAYGF